LLASALTRRALSIWCCDIARGSRNLPDDPNGERTAAALLPVWEPCGSREGDEYTAAQEQWYSKGFRKVGVDGVVLDSLQADVARR
jgi:hypothetical protein